MTVAAPVADGATGGTDELRQSMQDIVDQFMSRERRDQ